MVLGDILEEKLEQAVRAIRAAGGAADGVVADVTRDRGVENRLLRRHRRAARRRSERHVRRSRGARDPLHAGRLGQQEIGEDHLTIVENRVQTIHPGTARGRLLGGNLTVLTSLVGSDYLPDWDGCILFLEDVEEAPYRIDRMLTSSASRASSRRPAP